MAMALVGGLGACGRAQENDVASEQAAPAQAPTSFADAEQRMSEAMMAAIGSDVGQNWAKKMIAHHQGAIDMSEIVLQQNPKPDVATMARDTIEKQRKDISDIEKLLKDGPPDQQSAELYRPSMMEMGQKMKAAMGTDASDTYMRKMLEHHKGAVAMSDVALGNGVSGVLREQVRKTRDDNAKEAKMVEAMLRGETMQQAMAENDVKPAEQATAEPAPADKARARPTAAPKPTAEPKAASTPPPKTEPAAGDCPPEHRAAGHC